VLIAFKQINEKIQDDRFLAITELERQCRLGYSRMKIVDGPVDVEFRGVNPRPFKIEVARRLLHSFKTQGLQLQSEDAMIKIAIDRDSVNLASVSSNYSDDVDVPLIVWADSVTSVHAFGGQHRVAALRLWIEELKNTIEHARKQALRSEKVKTGPLAGRSSEILTTIDQLKIKMEELAFWPVVCYDIGGLIFSS
jgi:hypothetical protein